MNLIKIFMCEYFISSFTATYVVRQQLIKATWKDRQVVAVLRHALVFENLVNIKQTFANKGVKKTIQFV